MKKRVREKIVKNIFGNVLYTRVFIIIMIILMFSLANDHYISMRNIRNLMTDIVPYFIMGMGITFVLLVGSIDLSVGALVSAVTCVLAVYLPRIGVWAFFIVILMGILSGFVNGFLVVILKLPSFIATLGIMSVWSSVAYLVSGSQAVQILRAQWGLIAWEKIYIGIIPLTFIISIIIWKLLYKIENSTVFGKGVYAVGVNEKAAQIAGVNVYKIKILSFVVCGLCSALSGITVAAKLKGGIPTAGDAMTLLVIASVVLGGTVLEGGKGGVLFTLIGTAIVVMIQNGLNMVGITSFYQDIVFGILIILAVYASVDRSRLNMIVK